MTVSISPESDYEIHCLAKAWDIPVTQARERAYHYAAFHQLNSTPEMERAAAIRQAEAAVEM
ncbi:hypothetical protein RPMA_18900 [Tardiphaga alba]|uniref:DUF3606 domain-containing protein n=1 Tax=Tardiphaga alba TaxID=340268 RepID=A0ABX8AE19_9BRAD|nr:hypothetical protein [Tardiphaga alba]QUS40668.1 hypothetical protein RPMA_18900 [Tardiphaga alba]